MDWYSVVISSLTGVFAIAGTIIGNVMGRKTEMKRQKKELVIDAYARFMSCVLDCSQKSDFQSAKELSVAAARLRLICSQKSKDISDEIALLAIQRPIDKVRISNLLEQLSECARKEII